MDENAPMTGCTLWETYHRFKSHFVTLYIPSWKEPTSGYQDEAKQREMFKKRVWFADLKKKGKAIGKSLGDCPPSYVPPLYDPFLRLKDHPLVKNMSKYSDSESASVSGISTQTTATDPPTGYMTRKEQRRKERSERYKDTKSKEERQREWEQFKRDYKTAKMQNDHKRTETLESLFRADIQKTKIKVLEKLASRGDEDALAKLREELGLVEVVPILEGEDAEKPSANKHAREMKRGKKKKKQSGIELIESSDDSRSSNESDNNTNPSKRTITKQPRRESEKPDDDVEL